MTPNFSSLEEWESFLFAESNFLKNKSLNFSNWSSEVELHERFEYELRKLSRDFRLESEIMGTLDTERSVFFGSARGNELALIKALETSQLVDRMPAKTSPATTQHSLARFIAEEIRSQGPAHYVSATCTSSLVVIEQAMNSIQSERSSSALVGAGELTGSDFLRKSLKSAGLISRSPKDELLAYEPLREDFRKQSGGLVLGDGLGIGLLQPIETARTSEKDGLVVLDVVSTREHGLTPTGVSQGAVHLQRAVKLVLERNDLEPKDVKFIFAHGAGTRKGDAEEINAYREIFDDRVSIHSCRWSIGHQLGASGFFSMVFASLCFKNRRVPVMPYNENLAPNIGRSCDIKKENATSLVVSLGFGGLASVALVEPL